MRRTVIGLTLIELLIALAIVAILALMAPSLGAVVERYRALTAIEFLYRNIQYARSRAVSMQRQVTLCGTLDRVSCTRDWRAAELMIFLDEDWNKQRDPQDVLLRATPLPAGRITWRGANRNYMRFNMHGGVVDFGTYTYCPTSGNLRWARQLTINRGGRAYRSRDWDGDGYHDANTSAGINCPP